MGFRTGVRLPSAPPEKERQVERLVFLFQLNPSSMDEITCVMKSDFVGLGDGFNFICEADFIQAPLGFHRERKRTISLKKNGYARVRIHTQKRQKYLFCGP